MQIRQTDLEGVLIIEPRVFHDDRGFFLEQWNAERYRAHGLPGQFVQDNLSCSRRGVLRGLHFQNPHAQGKLVTVLSGAVFDVAVDLRVGSPTFGRWTAVELTAENRRQFYIPEGFAHGFLALEDDTLVQYKCTAPYAPTAEQSLRWDDPDIAIAWPDLDPVLSPKDAAAPFLRELSEAKLFTYAPSGLVAAE
ncbi:MAG: dTDP-4-dehydrorhamnose 3,5-epimerase [Bacteroidetes bacterium]|nr:dTDP-4-dehydrorhamnose 3,5-epimerase [Rhodothermaceae bacterium RA]RMH68455.1 MAG: dTDP-4-dehydrorhamnose 3,5-epimerase [Bacteroidota bacterium]